MILILSQIIGLAAVALYLLSYQLKNRKQMVWATCISNGLYVLQYVLLGAFSGAVMDMLSTVGSFLAGRKHSVSFRKHTRLIAFLNLALIAVAGIVIAVLRKDYIELIPVAGAIFQTGGLWCEKEQNIRKFGLIGAPFWLVYNFISRAYGACLGSILIIASAVVAIMRFRKGNAYNQDDKSSFTKGD